MIKGIYSRTFTIMGKLPFRLWGISLLSGLLAFLTAILGINVPIVTIPIVAALSAGIASVFFKVYNGGEADTKTLFSPFADLKTFKRTAGGMCWRTLWTFLWFIIPIAGPFIAIVKSLSYSFTPYILNEEKNVGATDALKKSMTDTKGLKGYMFIAIVLPAAAFAVLSGILSLLSLIPYAGIVFLIINIIVSLVYGLFAPMFFGLVSAGFYEYGKKPVKKTAPKLIKAADNGNENVCGVCGNKNPPDKKFCMKCGAKL